ncbi:hypothetical protein N483_26345 [Pseudoalteromonas luteoviolacea NCIMB 1944]|uniref:Transposase IS200-like domain-containing protein n=2 Tax=Pseudoalteromonas luteoviolacea TaxID=43657 RepID=V4H9V9_PSEL2|nr:hypothetical protein PL2TA16_01954 [Pseudoalteromonas luteoviolacea 2ta16]KZN33294.1 hypothetical protein N483_26345 [Pseudoalteromonas luteoviolacea NCIMB 1944]
MKFLSSVFAIDIAAYAIMSNHYHMVVKVNRQEAINWSDDEVITRWYRLYKGSPVIDRYLQEQVLSDAEQSLVSELITKWRARLYDISWYMKNLNEYIAKKANKEDDCTGKYWEGRYKSQALLDEIALLSCMAYVDLNPIRANMAKKLEESDFTSIQERLKQFETIRASSTQQKHREVERVASQPKLLKPFGGGNQEHTLPFSLLGYLSLVDWTGRHAYLKQRGHIAHEVPNILESLNIKDAIWLGMVKSYGRRYANFVGMPSKLKAHAAKNDMYWYKGAG